MTNVNNTIIIPTVNNIRASFMLPPILHQRLVIASKQEDKSLSEMVRELLDRELTRREHIQIDRMYEELKAMDGVGEPGVTDASITVDEILYGENGAWRGSER